MPESKTPDNGPSDDRPGNDNKKPEDNKPGMGRHIVNVFILSACFAAVAEVGMLAIDAVVGPPSNPQPQPVERPYTDVIKDSKKSNLNNVKVDGNRITGTFKDKDGTQRDFVSVLPEADPMALKDIRDNGASIAAAPKAESAWYTNYLLAFGGPVLLIGGFLGIMMWQAKKMSGKNGFTQARTKGLQENGKKVTFADVAGVDEAKEDVQEIVAFLKDPQKFKAAGAKAPKGTLLVGPPGTGKTLLARAVAGESGVSFLSISGSDFVEMFVGVGAGRVRNLFEQAKAKQGGCIIFIDELDALGRQRGAGMGGGHDEREQALNQLLVEMDGFNPTDGIVLMAATNRPDVLDPALLRPGRFDRQVTVDKPRKDGRFEILKIHGKGKKFEEDVSLEKVAKTTIGFSGADLANLLNEAAIFAARRDSTTISRKDIEEARDKVRMGAKRKSHVMNERDKQITAWHEAGHALVAHLLPDADPVGKVSIVPRGRAAGVTMQEPEEDKTHYTRDYLDAHMAVLHAGRLAELILAEGNEGKVTAGASNDLDRVTEVAGNMVKRWGMSRLGPMTFGKEQEEVFLGRAFGQAQGGEYSEKTARDIDAEIKRIIQEAAARTKAILEANPEALRRIAEAVLTMEEISGEDIETIMKDCPGGGIVPPLPASPATGAAGPQHRTLN